MFFSTFEPITLTPNARNTIECPCSTILQAALTSPACSLARNVLGRVPLTPCFMRGNRTLTLAESCPTALETARQQWLTAGMELATAAGCLSSTFGCGVTAGVSHACCQGRAAEESSHLWRSQEGWRDSEASQGRARGRLLQPTIPGH